MRYYLFWWAGEGAVSDMGVEVLVTRGEADAVIKSLLDQYSDLSYTLMYGILEEERK